jgi:hypothetical protein
MSSELIEVSSRWFQAWLDKDAATVEELAAEDYVYVAPTGVIFDRQAILGIIRSPTYRLDRATRTEIVARPLGTEAGWCGTAIRVPGPSRAPPSRTTSAGSWSGRSEPAVGAS